MSAKTKLRVGLVGYGFMGRTHSNAFAKVNQFFDLKYQPVLAAVCARDASKVEAFAAYKLDGHARRLYAALADKKRLRQHHWVFGIDELRGILGVENRKAYDRFNNFRARVLAPAVEQINDFGTVKETTVRFEGVLPNLARRYRETGSDYVREQIETYMSEKTCRTCKGARLKPETLAVLISGDNIDDVTKRSIREALDFFHHLTLNEKEQAIARLILREIEAGPRVEKSGDQPRAGGAVDVHAGPRHPSHRGVPSAPTSASGRSSS